MKNSRKVIALALCVAMMSSVVLLSSCSSQKANETSEVTEAITSETTQGDEATEETTVATSAEASSSLGMRIYAEFTNCVNNGDDREAIAEALSSSRVTGYDCLSMEVEEGYLNGFDDQITGFTGGTMIGPVIGSVPMLIYVFESDDPAALKDELLSHADPRWNICTEADETVCEVSDNYVFFCMVPNE